MVFCIPLISDDKNYNMEIKKLNLYQVDSQRGVDFLEPVVIPSKDDKSDSRIDDFFGI